MMRLHGTIPGSSLLYALMIVLLVSGVTSAMILLAQHHKVSVDRWIAELSIEQLSMSGAHAALSTLGMGEIVEEDLPDLSFGNQSVKAMHRPWGVFSLVEVRAEIGSVRHDRRCLYGYTSSPTSSVLEIVGPSKGLKLCGDARISGDLLITNTNVERGYIEGESYTGKQLVFGQILPAAVTDVQIRSDIIGRASLLAGVHGVAMEGRITSEQISSKVDLFEAHRVVELDHNAILSDGIWSDCMLRSTGSITVLANCSINRAILQSPEIIVEAGAHINGQLFATRQILISMDAILSYPSALLLVPDSSGSFINLKAGALVEGLVMIMDPKDLFDGKLNVHEGAEILGTVAVQGKVQNRGTITGRTIARSVHLRTESASYSGYILGGKFGSSTRSDSLGLGIGKLLQGYTLIDKDWS